jgi:hypothetical protein
MSSITPGVDQLLASIEAASRPGRRAEDAGSPSPGLMARLRAMTRRAQYVDEHYCFIEETPWHGFVLHGLPGGRRVMVPDPHMDDDLSESGKTEDRPLPMPDRPEFRLVLEPLGEQRHLIVGMTSPAQADEFGRVRWKTVGDETR